MSYRNKPEAAETGTPRRSRWPTDTRWVGSKLVYCQGCGRRDTANRRIVKGSTIPHCVHCREEVNQ